MSKRIKKLDPPATIGLIGGGQLGRMFAFEAKRMGYHVVVLDPKQQSPAGQVADEQIVAGFDDLEALRALAKKSDVITFEFEHLHVALLNRIEQEGACVIPSSRTLAVIQNKYTQKKMLRELGVKVPEFGRVNSLNELTEEFHRLGGKAILKTCTDGYDGKGNIVLKSASALESAYNKFGEAELLVEALVDFKREVSIIVAKNEEGICYYPVVENIHQNSILIKTLVPAEMPEALVHKIQAAGKKIVDAFEDYGVYCIEFFVDQEDEILVNEIAPRPHNSGHYSIENCITSQFEQLVRVVTGMPLGSTHLRKACAMYNLLGDEAVAGEYEIGGLEALLELPDCHFHLYGKSDTTPFKKIGHITVLAETVASAECQARFALEQIRIKPKNRI